MKNIRGTKPPSVTTQIQRSITKDLIISPGDKVLVACSGGGDSISLLHGLTHFQKKYNFSIVVASINHGLRSEASSEVEMVKELATKFNLSFLTSTLSLSYGGNIQERARNARFEALGDLARQSKSNKIATGHTANDRAETILQRIVRGTGLKGLGVLPPKAPFPLPGYDDLQMIRPLHNCMREDINRHLKKWNLKYVNDPSNQNLRFTRVKMRNEIIPKLAEINPQIVEALCRLADDAIEDSEHEVLICK